MPLVGEWICDKNERLLTALILRVFEIGDFLERIKQETLLNMSRTYTMRIAKLMQEYQKYKSCVRLWEYVGI